MVKHPGNAPVKQTVRNKKVVAHEEA